MIYLILWKMIPNFRIAVVFSFFFFILPGISYADWQSTLEGQFDIVETFDNLQDWKGSNTGNVGIENFPSDFPKKLDGTNSVWGYYSYYGGTPVTNWIQNHGANNVWQGTGKSLVIDYQEGSVNSDYGPSRLGLKIGNSPDAGYPNEVHLFYVTKWLKSFFKTTGNDFDYHRFLKTLDISSGFKTNRLWGTDAERAWMQSNCTSPYPKTQVSNQYGMNAQIYNFTTGTSYGNKESELITVLYSQQPGESAAYCHYNGSTMYGQKSAQVGQPILTDAWFGLEYRVKTSNPHGAANGEFELWVYDAVGNEIGHQLTAGIINFKDGSTPFNHAWNKFVFGGNRFDGFYCGSAGPGCDFGSTEHYYVDDVIVNSTRIAPTYFGLLGVSSIILAPSNNFRINQENYQAYTVSGAAQALSSIEAFANGVSLGATTVSSNGLWTISGDFSPMLEGTITLTAVSGADSSVPVIGVFDKTPPTVVSGVK